MQIRKILREFSTEGIEDKRLRFCIEYGVSLVANANFEGLDGYGQISQLYTQSVLQRSELCEVFLADIDGNLRVESSVI